MPCNLCLLKSALVLSENLWPCGCPSRSGVLSWPCPPASMLGWEHVWSQMDPSAAEMPQLFFCPLPPHLSLSSPEERSHGKEWASWAVIQPLSSHQQRPCFCARDGVDGGASSPVLGLSPARLLCSLGLTPTHSGAKLEHLVLLPLPGELLCLWGNIWAFPPCSWVLVPVCRGPE